MAALLLCFFSIRHTTFGSCAEHEIVERQEVCQVGAGLSGAKFELFEPIPALRWDWPLRYQMYAKGTVA